MSQNKRLATLVKGIRDFVKDFGVRPDMAIMHPTTLSQLNKEISQIPESMSDINRAISKTERIQDPHMAKESIILVMKDGSL